MGHGSEHLWHVVCWCRRRRRHQREHPGSGEFAWLGLGEWTRDVSVLAVLKRHGMLTPGPDPAYYSRVRTELGKRLAQIGSHEKLLVSCNTVTPRLGAQTCMDTSLPVCCAVAACSFGLLLKVPGRHACMHRDRRCCPKWCLPAKRSSTSQEAQSSLAISPTWTGASSALLQSNVAMPLMQSATRLESS